MNPAAQTYNEEQRRRWNEDDGEFWVREQERLDRTLAPVLPPLLEFAAPRAGSVVMDVGCGCGATTVELAKAVGPAGRVVGVDLSEPMLRRAAERVREYPHVSCRGGDAAQLRLDDIGAELALSRFGVMFFGDPEAAFANIRKGLAPGGRLRFVCWRPIQENPWLQVPLHAVYEHAPRLPKPEPEEPGPFSFGDPGRVTRILKGGGFTTPSFTRLDLELNLAPGGTLEDAAAQSTQMGPSKRALADQPEQIRTAAIESVRRALKPYLSADGVKLAGAMWLVGAEREG